MIKNKTNIEHPVAVIMSLYRNDTLAFVRQAVESVLYQTYADFDYYIHADGPIQNEVREYISHLDDTRIRFSERDTNLGLAQSLNDMLEIILPQPYEFIARMDADDICAPDRFEKQIAYLTAHPETECLGTAAIEIQSDNSEYYRKSMPVTHEQCYELFRKRDCMIHPTVMFRPSFFEKAGLYSLDTYFGEDTMLWAQGFASGCRFANLPEMLYYFRIDDHFFERRRGWKHAINIFKLRHRVNKMVGYRVGADCWALAYAIAKLMPTKILNKLYQTARK